MSFTSVAFLVFLAGFLALWPWVRHRDTPRWAIITAFSFVFYGWWDWRFAFLLAGTGLLDFAAALAMVRWPAQRRWLLLGSVGTNVAVLFFFKYAWFAAHESWLLFDWPSVATLDAARAIILPVGISFYTFQSMSYTIDVYRGQLVPTRNALHFLAYLSLFPQLVAGPIIRAVDLLPQLTHAGDYHAANRWLGLERIAIGFFKKLVIADNLAPVVAQLFAPERAATLGGAEVAVAAMLFGLQILCDFSGYSDIAIGIAKWMGYEFPENFRRPYSALGLRDFWTRWHISLSTWFRDYVYIPLGGSRGSPWRSTANLWLTLLLSGLWHGANATFIAWGALHAALLSFERATGWPEKFARFAPGRVLGTLATFAAVSVGWIFFRAEDLRQALTLCGTLFTAPASGLAAAASIFTPGVLVAVAAFAATGLGAAAREHPTLGAQLARPGLRLGGCVACLVAAVFFRGPGNAFIYFQF